MKTHEGKLQAKGLRIGLVVGRFNDFLTAKLLDGALDALKRLGAEEADLTLLRVPGSFELPLVARRLARSKKVDGVLLLGALVRGDTPHFDFLAAEVTKGAAQVALEDGIPVSFGVLTVETVEQGIERAGTKSGNKGWDAAVALVETVNLLKDAKI